MESRRPFLPFSPGRLAGSGQPPPGSAQSSGAHRLLPRQSPRPPPPDTCARRGVQRESAPLRRKRGSNPGKRAEEKQERRVGGKKERKRKKKRKNTHTGEARGSMQICSLQTANHGSSDAMQRTSLCNEGGWSSFPQKSPCLASLLHSPHIKATRVLRGGEHLKSSSLSSAR